MKFYRIFVAGIIACSLIGCIPVQQQTSLRQDRDRQIDDAENLALAGKRICTNQRHAGTIKTLVESVNCSNPKIIAAYERVKFPYMDLVKQYTEKRLELVEKVENKEISEAQFHKEIYECLPYLRAEAHVRDLEVRVDN
jgi:hypothetical protein